MQGCALTYRALLKTMLRGLQSWNPKLPSCFFCHWSAWPLQNVVATKILKDIFFAALSWYQVHTTVRCEYTNARRSHSILKVETRKKGRTPRPAPRAFLGYRLLTTSNTKYFTPHLSYVRTTLHYSVNVRTAWYSHVDPNDLHFPPELYQVFHSFPKI